MITEQWLKCASLVLLLSANVSANPVACEYDANEEWPWHEDRVCQTKAPQLSPLLLADFSQSQIPFCLNSKSDPDGDGWGFENDQSCLIETIAGHPKCTDIDSDSDNDGWGWENDKTCVTENAGLPPELPECIYRSSDPDGDGWGFESGSCRVTVNSDYSVCSSEDTDPDGDGWGYENGESCRVRDSKVQSPILQQNFDRSQNGLYSGQQLNEQWDTPLWHLGFDQGRAHIIAESDRGNVLRITYPGGAYGAAGASAFLSDLEFGVGLPKSYDELYISYDLKFANGFEFVKGGKLPGLCGYDNTQSPVQGCNSGGGIPDGFDGWSARGMWREDGVLENYVYHSDQQNFFGDDEFWGVIAVPGQWHRVQHRVVLNTVGQADGVLEAWFDGSKVLSLQDFVYRKTPGIGINLFYFSTFFGGNDSSWAPTVDQYVFFDNFRIATDSYMEAAKSLALNDDSTDGSAAADDPLPLENAQADADVAVVGNFRKSNSGGGTIAFSMLILLVGRRIRK